jgi:Flp pilus assembly protein TadD
VLSFDRFPARTETRELAREAESAYQRGTSLLQQRKNEEAVELLRKAHTLERENAGYELQLGNALAAVGKPDDAEPLIMDALGRRATDGAANLAAARLMVMKGHEPEAESFFHRAIYGEWKENGATYRIATRFELIELLAEAKHKQEMPAELISLEAETGTDRETRKRLARLLLRAGSPVRAATVYLDLTNSDPTDSEPLIGLGEAELGNGNYRAARNSFLRAELHKRGAAIQSRLQLLDTLTALDPMPRQLTSLEKYRRSIGIVDLARSDLEQLAQSNPSTDSAQISDLLKRASEVPAKRQPAYVSNEVAEAVLSLAEQLWRTRTQDFGTVASPDKEALRRLLERLAS